MACEPHATRLSSLAALANLAIKLNRSTIVIIFARSGGGGLALGRELTSRSPNNRATSWDETRGLGQ